MVCNKLVKGDLLILRVLHLPVNQFEHFLQNGEQNATALDLPGLVGLVLGQAEHLLHLPDELVENVRIHYTKQDQECGADGAANDSADGTEAVKLRGNGCSSCRDDNRCNDDDSGILLAYKLTHPIGFTSTHVEWPREKKVPTVTGFCPVASSRLVIKSMACSSSVLVKFEPVYKKTYRDMISIERMSQPEGIS